MKLLLVEDNMHLAGDLSRFLTESGFVVEHAPTLSAAMERVFPYEYDLIIPDIGLPDGNGLHLIDEMKQNNINTSILIVTAKNAIEDKVKGLELGADDYITKPLHKSEFNAPIRPIIRRGKFNGNNVISVGDLQVDVAACQVKIKEQVLNLTHKKIIYCYILFIIT